MNRLLKKFFQKKVKNFHHGYTLIEILVVTAIFSIAGIGISMALQSSQNIFSFVNDDTALQTNLTQIGPP